MNNFLMFFKIIFWCKFLFTGQAWNVFTINILHMLTLICLRLKQFFTLFTRNFFFYNVVATDEPSNSCKIFHKKNRVQYWVVVGGAKVKLILNSSYTWPCWHLGLFNYLTILLLPDRKGNLVTQKGGSPMWNYVDPYFGKNVLAGALCYV